MAVRLGRWSAGLRYRHDLQRRAVRFEEFQAVIADVPGKLSKLARAAGFFGCALAFRLWECALSFVRRFTWPSSRRLSTLSPLDRVRLSYRYLDEGEEWGSGEP